MPKKSSVPTEVRYNSPFASAMRQKMAEKGTTQKELAEYYGLTIDYLLTGNFIDDIPVRENLELSQNTVEDMKLVKEGCFEDKQQMIYMLNYLLGDHDFYLTLEKT